MKQSPSVIEIGGINDGGMQSDPSNAGDLEKTLNKKGSQSKSPVNRLQQKQVHPNSITDQSDDDLNQNNRGLNRDNKQTRSNRKIKPMYPMPNQAGSKNILKVVHEADNSSAHESNQL